MKKTFTFLSFLTLCASSTAFADGICKDKFGVLRCGSGTIAAIDYLGQVDISGSTVLGLLKVRGNVDIEEAKLNEMRIQGNSHLTATMITGFMQIIGNVTAKEVEITNRGNLIGNFSGNHVKFGSATNIVGIVECDHCVFKGSTTFIGEVETYQTEFLAPLLLNARTSHFVNSNLTDITVKKPSDNENQTVYLTQGTHVKNISFENKKGTVVLSENSTISGAVVGATVVNNLRSKP